MMVDRDIMQAMQNCVNGCAKKCPYDEMSLAYEKCMSDLMRDALDLLNRQNAEIEGLQKTLENRNEADRIALEAYEQLLYENDYQQGEIERLKRHNEICGRMLSETWERIEELDNLNETARVNAIKEFTERLMENKYYTGNPTGYGTYAVMIDTINKIAEKMIGEGNV